MYEQNSVKLALTNAYGQNIQYVGNRIHIQSSQQFPSPLSASSNFSSITEVIYHSSLFCVTALKGQQSEIFMQASLVYFCYHAYTMPFLSTN